MPNLSRGGAFRRFYGEQFDILRQDVRVKLEVKELTVWARGFGGWVIIALFIVLMESL